LSIVKVKSKLTVQQCCKLITEVEYITTKHKDFVGCTPLDRIQILYPALSICKYFTNLCVEYGNTSVENKLKAFNDLICNDEYLSIHSRYPFKSIHGDYPKELLLDIQNTINSLVDRYCMPPNSKKHIEGSLILIKSLQIWIAAKL